MSSFPKTTPKRVFLTAVARKVPRTPAVQHPENSRSARRRRRVDNLLPLNGVTAAAIAANSSILFLSVSTKENQNKAEVPPLAGEVARPPLDNGVPLGVATLLSGTEATVATIYS